MAAITITLKKIKACSPCNEGYVKALKYFGPDFDRDQPIPASEFLDSNGLDDTLWLLRCLPEYDNLWRLYAVWCASQVKHLMRDERSLNALVVAEQHALGQTTDEELAEAKNKAWAAVRADKSHTGKQEAKTAAWVTWNSARDAADFTASEAAYAVKCEAMNTDAWATARNTQAQTLRHLLDTGEINIDGWTYYLHTVMTS